MAIDRRDILVNTFAGDFILSMDSDGTNVRLCKSDGTVVTSLDVSVSALDFSTLRSVTIDGRNVTGVSRLPNGEDETVVIGEVALPGGGAPSIHHGQPTAFLIEWTVQASLGNNNGFDVDDVEGSSFSSAISNGQKLLVGNQIVSIHDFIDASGFTRVHVTGNHTFNPGERVLEFQAVLNEIEDTNTITANIDDNGIGTFNLVNENDGTNITSIGGMALQSGAPNQFLTGGGGINLSRGGTILTGRQNGNVTISVDNSNIPTGTVTFVDFIPNGGQVLVQDEIVRFPKFNRAFIRISATPTTISGFGTTEALALSRITTTNADDYVELAIGSKQDSIIDVATTPETIVAQIAEAGGTGGHAITVGPATGFDAAVVVLRALPTDGSAQQTGIDVAGSPTPSIVQGDALTIGSERITVRNDVRPGTFEGQQFTRIFFTTPVTQGTITIGDIVARHENAVSSLETDSNISITAPGADGVATFGLVTTVNADDEIATIGGKTLAGGGSGGGSTTANTLRNGQVLPSNDAGSNAVFSGLPDGFVVNDIFLVTPSGTPGEINDNTLPFGIWILTEAIGTQNYQWNFDGLPLQWNSHIPYYPVERVEQIVGDETTVFQAHTYSGPDLIFPAGSNTSITLTDVQKVNANRDPSQNDIATILGITPGLYYEDGIADGQDQDNLIGNAWDFWWRRITSFVGLKLREVERGIRDEERIDGTEVYEELEIFNRTGTGNVGDDRGTRWQLAKTEDAEEASDIATLPDIIDATNNFNSNISVETDIVDDSDVFGNGVDILRLDINGSSIFAFVAARHIELDGIVAVAGNTILPLADGTDFTITGTVEGESLGAVLDLPGDTEGYRIALPTSELPAGFPVGRPGGDDGSVAYTKEELQFRHSKLNVVDDELYINGERDATRQWVEDQGYGDGDGLTDVEDGQPVTFDSQSTIQEATTAFVPKRLYRVPASEAEPLATSAGGTGRAGLSTIGNALLGVQTPEAARDILQIEDADGIAEGVDNQNEAAGETENLLFWAGTESQYQVLVAADSVSGVTIYHRRQG